MSRVIVELPLDRDFCGRLFAFDDMGQLLCGPFPVAARAGDVRARSAGNPARNPLLRYGDTPTGTYRVTRVAQVIVLEATAGDAALAEANGRYRLFIQGGEPGPDGALRSTSGNLRLADADLVALITALGEEKNVRVDVVAHAGVPASQAVHVDDSVQDDDPPEIPGAPSSLREMFGELSRRDALRAGAGGAAGLTALSLAVSFVSLGTTSRADVYTQMAYNEQPVAAPAPGGGETSGGEQQQQQGSGNQNQTIQLNPGANTPEAKSMTPTPNEGAAPATGARQQLENATNGTQTLDQTFTGGRGGSDTAKGNVQVPETTAAPVQLIDSQQQQLNANADYQKAQAAQAAADQSAADQAAKLKALDDQKAANPSLMQNQQFLNNYMATSQAASTAASAAQVQKIQTDNVIKRVVGTPIYKPAPAKPKTQ